ncbi:hypothetical protein [Paraglaciecola sp.]|uniref:hypothetical protein n=1 Tax=Paraglaciecola sp. TaxID=1920173 RepID=UPI003299ED73
MKSFFTLLVLVTIFTLGAKYEIVKFSQLQSENIAKDNFEFFLYIYILLTGLLAASSYEERSLFRKFIRSFTGLIKSIYLGFSGALVGWGLGLTLYVISIGEFSSIALGLVLTSFMLLFAMAPAWYHEQILAQKDSMTGFIFTKPRFAKLFQYIGYVFVLASLFGLYDCFDT